jgi:hypothetical protein
MYGNMGVARVVAAKITNIAMANCMVYLPSPLEIEQTKDSGHPP